MQIPRFISKTESTPAINNVRMDPSVAAAPYRAAEQSTAHLVDIFQSELGAWNKVLQEKQAEQAAADAKNRKIADSLYGAEASAQLSMGASDISRKVLSESDGTTNHAALADAEFQKLVDGVVANAPSDMARVNVVKKAMKMRAGMYSNMTNASIKANNQVNMDRIEGMLSQYEAHASQNPADIDEIRKQSSDVFKSMEELGLPAGARSHIQNKFLKNLDYQAAAATAEKDPMSFKQALESGQLDYLGQSSVSKLKHTAESSLKAVRKQALDSLKDVEKSIMSGMPIPKDFDTRAALASKVGLDNELIDIQRLSEVSKSLSGKKLPELLAASAELKSMAANGEIDGDPAKIKKLIKFVDTQAGALKKDPFQFASNQGAFTPLNPVADFKSLSPDEANTRKYRAMQVEEMYGVKSSALSRDEMKIALAQLDSEPLDGKVAVLNSLGSLGDSTISEIVHEADRKKDLGLGQAIRLSRIDPETTKVILSGREMLKSGDAKMEKDSSSQFKRLAESLAVDQSIKDAAIAAAGAYHVADKGTDMSSAFNKANNIVSVDRKGWFTGKYSTIAPAPGMSSDDFTSLVSKGLVSSDDWKSFGTGVPAQTASGKALPANRIKADDYDYVMQKDGRYKVMYEGSEVYDSAGIPIKVDLVGLHSSNTK